jgi:hypothetical protein
VSSDDSMGQDYTVHHDGPRANGSGSNGAQKLSAEQELIGALLTNPALLAVVADVGLQEAHFAQGSGFRGAFRFAPQGAEQIREILKNGQRGTTFNLLALLVELNVRISEQRAEHLARAIIAGAESRRDSSEKDEHFVAPRLYATDPTIERLSSLLQARPRGMTLLRARRVPIAVGWRRVRYFGGLSRFSAEAPT